MTQRPAVLIVQRHLAPLGAFLEGAHEVYRLWEAPPLEAEHDIRALIVQQQPDAQREGLGVQQLKQQVMPVRRHRRGLHGADAHPDP